jgi:hypothetical protein
MIDRIAQILEDLFDIPHAKVEASDHLKLDWGIDENEKQLFDYEFCKEFGIDKVPRGVKTVEDYAGLIG